PHRGGGGESANHSPTTAATAAGKAAVVAAVVVRWLGSGGGVGCGAAVVPAAYRWCKDGAGCRKAAAVGMVTGGSGVLMVAVDGLDRSGDGEQSWGSPEKKNLRPAAAGRRAGEGERGGEQSWGSPEKFRRKKKSPTGVGSRPAGW
nr:hypothetical protein [Tanacetum cinerariifolium]